MFFGLNSLSLSRNTVYFWNGIVKQYLFLENDIIKKAALDVMKKEMLKPK